MEGSVTDFLGRLRLPVVDALPTTAEDGEMVYLSTDDKAYFRQDGAWVAAGGTIVVESSGVDVENDDSIDYGDSPTITLFVVDDDFVWGDALSDSNLIVEEDHFDLGETSFDVDGDVTPSEMVMLRGSTNKVIDTPIQITVNDAPVLNPDVADLYRLHPQIADMLLNVGEPTEFTDDGWGFLKLTSESANFRQIRQDEPNFSGPVVPGGFGTHISADFRASNSLTTPNARMLIASWNLHGVKRVRWGNGNYAPDGMLPFLGVYVLNQSITSAPPFSFSALIGASPTGGAFDPDKTWTWSNSSTFRSIMQSTPNGTSLEREDGTAAVGSPITGPRRSDLFELEPFNTRVNADCGLHMLLFQDTGVISALELVASEHFQAWLQFKING